MSKELNLFPLHGIDLGKTKMPELRDKYGKEKIVADSKALKDGPMGAIAINLEGVWFVFCSQMIATMVLLQEASALPKEWIKQGMRWEMSCDEWREFFEKRNGNYDATDLSPEFKTGTLSSVAKQSSGLYYRIKLEFEGESGDKLASIEIMANNYNGKDKKFEQLYKEKSVVKNESSDNESENSESD